MAHEIEDIEMESGGQPTSQEPRTPRKSPPKKQRAERQTTVDDTPIAFMPRPDAAPTKGIEDTVYNKLAPLFPPVNYKKPALPEFTDVGEALYYSRCALLKAANMADDSNTATKLLDFLNIFREFTDKGYTTYQTQLEQQVQSLNTNMNKLSRRIMTEPVHSSQPKPAPTWAKTAQSTEKTISIEAPKKKAPPPLTDRDRQVIVIRDFDYPFNSTQIRDQINAALEKVGQRSPIVRSVQKAFRSDNIIITTMPGHSGQWLIDHKEYWEKLLVFSRLQVNKGWHKVCVHGIPLRNYQSGEDFIQNLSDEVTIFNPDLKIVGSPYWLTSQEKRESANQFSGSACVAFATEAEAKRAISRGLYIAGANRRTERMHSVPPSTQCYNCQQFGHQETRCTEAASCQYCGLDHHTKRHHCRECRSHGRPCRHLIAKCANCKENHQANDKTCSVYLATKTKPTNPDTPVIDTENPEDLNMDRPDLLIPSQQYGQQTDVQEQW